MRKLLAIVRPHVPTADRLDPDKLFRSFSACFDRIANIGCQPTLYSNCGLCWSVDECRTWLRAREAIANDVDAPAFIAAVLVRGDVNYCPHDDAVGNVWEFFESCTGSRPVKLKLTALGQYHLPPALLLHPPWFERAYGFKA
jgi:hypothetical protein